MNETPGREKLYGFFDYYIFFSLLIFFVWSFLGGHKQVVFGINSDHISVAIAFFGAVVSILRHARYTPLQYQYALFAMGILVYFLLGSAFALDPAVALKRTAVHSVYYVIVFGAAFFFLRHQRLFYPSLIGSAFFSSCVVLLACWFMGFGSWGRVTIPVYSVDTGQFAYFPGGYETSSDPNVLAFFLYLGVLLILRTYGFSGRWKLLIIVPVLAAFLTFSRSLLLSFIVAVAAGWAVTFAAACLKGRVRRAHFSAPSLFGLLAAALAALYVVALFVDRFLFRFSGSSSNRDRIERLVYYQHKVTETDWYHWLIGHGPGAIGSDLDPHNYFLTMFYDTGLIGTGLVTALLVSLLIKSLRWHSGRILVGVSFTVFVYFLVAAQFYWQVRTFYFVILIMLFSVFVDERPARPLQHA